MFAWWNSLESVSYFNNRIQLLIICFGLLTALAMYLGYRASQQIDYLQIEDKKAMKHKINETEEKLTPRRLSEQQKEIIAQNLKEFKGTIINIKPISGDTESMVYSEDFASALITAGWQVEVLHGTFFGNIPFGLYLHIKDSNNPPPVTYVLMELLIQLGIKIDCIQDANSPPDVIELIVGARQ